MQVTIIINYYYLVNSNYYYRSYYQIRLLYKVGYSGLYTLNK